MMAEHDRLPRTPVLVKDLNAVLGGNSRHTDSVAVGATTSSTTPT
jgi:hypothetical protein